MSSRSVRRRNERLALPGYFGHGQSGGHSHDLCKYRPASGQVARVAASAWWRPKVIPIERARRGRAVTAAPPLTMNREDGHNGSPNIPKLPVAAKRSDHRGSVTVPVGGAPATTDAAAAPGSVNVPVVGSSTTTGAAIENPKLVEINARGRARWKEWSAKVNRPIKINPEDMTSAVDRYQEDVAKAAVKAKEPRAIKNSLEKHVLDSAERDRMELTPAREPAEKSSGTRCIRRACDRMFKGTP